MIWCIEHDIFPEYEEKFISTAEELGHKVIVCSTNWTKKSPFSFNSREPLESYRHLDIIFHGSINACRYLYKNTAWSIWTPDNVFDWNYYAPHFGYLLLNSDYVLQPFGNVLNYSNPANRHFIKPNNGYKPFGGRVLTRTELDIIKSENIFPEEICVLSRFKFIENEYRFLVVDGKVITGSSYIVKDEIKSELCSEGRAFDYAQYVVERVKYEPTLAWTIDIAESCGDFSVIEINSFSSAGLYDMDMELVVDTISRKTLEESY